MTLLIVIAYLLHGDLVIKESLAYVEADVLSYSWTCGAVHAAAKNLQPYIA